jgi:anti-anti-sigma regulatory factor
MPLLHQGRLTGLLYLEHRAAPDVFDPGRVALLGLLSAQTAIALENALLLASVEAATLQVRRANEQLEQDVARRTEELSHANAELARTNQQLSIELGERARAEKERALLQAQVIAVQQERMAEMATPLIPITDDIVVMPLIGTLDSERANQMLEVALSGTQRHRARVVILDITGIKHADTHVAEMLLRTAQALRLLGAEAVLSGMRPEIAKAFIALGVELGAVTTQGTLQSAIAHALRRTAAPRHRSALR